MTCDSVSKLIPLYFYGELTPDEEDRVEQHLRRVRGVLRARWTGSARWRRRSTAGRPRFRRACSKSCRADLMAADPGRRAARRARRQKGPWTLFLEALAPTFASMNRVRQPVGALALVALGFFAARFTGIDTPACRRRPTSVLRLPTTSSPPCARCGPILPARCRSPTTRPGGASLTGRTDDQAIQKLLLAAAHEENPAVRVESVDLLKERTGSSEVRDALLNALAHDPNAGVRLKALEGLKPLAADAAGPQDALPGAVERTRIRPSGCRSSTCWWRTATIGGRSVAGTRAARRQQLGAPEAGEGAQGHECVDRHFLARWPFLRAVLPRSRRSN